MADHDTHARQRKALSHGFSKKALWDQEPIVNEFVTKLMNNMHTFAQKGQVFDIVKWFNFVTFDVIGDLSFGESCGYLEGGDFHFWITLIFDAVKAEAIEQASRLFATPGSSSQRCLQRRTQGDLAKATGGPSGIQQGESHAVSLCYDWVWLSPMFTVGRRVQAKDSDRKDFIHYILKQSEVYDLSQDEVVVNAALVIVAGSETTASSLDSLMNNLLRHPKIYAKLKQEIRTAFNSADEIKLEAAQNLSYMSACIEENPRISPPAPIGFLREIPTGGDMIDGYFIPESEQCEVCRLRKTRCDAEKPSCTFCRTLGIECVYRGPSKSGRAHSDTDELPSRLERIESTLESVAATQSSFMKDPTLFKRQVVAEPGVREYPLLVVSSSTACVVPVETEGRTGLLA
nr:hypothetical protein LTR18_002330 [Exophiala xenobiotica]